MVLIAERAILVNVRKLKREEEERKERKGELSSR